MFPDSTTQNPWASPHDGPRFGNAYQDDEYTTTSNWQEGGYQQPIESNKTEYAPPPPTNPYQYAGTRLGQQQQEQYTGNVYGGTLSQQQYDNALPPSTQQQQQQQPINTTSTTTHPNKWRLLLRIILLIAAIGYIGFAAGASPKSGQPVPLSSTGCFYYLYAIAVLTILYSMYHIGYYVFRWYFGGFKTSRPMMTAVDFVLAIMWGVGIILEAARYPCPPGAYNGWCDFYNVSLFFGFVCFAGFLVATGWDIMGGCKRNQHS